MLLPAALLAVGTFKPLRAFFCSAAAALQRSNAQLHSAVVGEQLLDFQRRLGKVGRVGNSSHLYKTLGWRMISNS